MEAECFYELRGNCADEMQWDPVPTDPSLEAIVGTVIELLVTESVTNDDSRQKCERVLAVVLGADAAAQIMEWARA